MANIELTAQKPFVDKNDQKVSYKKGDKLNTDDVDRINDLVKRGLCDITSLEVADEKTDNITFGDKQYDKATMIAALKQIDGVSVAANAGTDNINSKIAALTDDQKTALSEILNKE